MPSFRYCLNASTIRGTPVLKQIQLAVDAGYEAIELWFADVDAHTAAGGSLEEVARAVRDSGLAVPTMIYLGGWFDCAESDWPNVRSTCLHRLEQAAQIGAGFVIAGPPAGRADPHLGARRYRELLDAGQRIGARPAMEFLGFVEQYCTIESAQEVLTLAQHPAGTLVLDPFHIFRGGGDMETIAQLPASQIAISHFNDTPASPPRREQQDSDRVWPGAGHLNLKRYLQLLHGTGYDRWLSLELFREDLWRRDPTEVAREGLIRMRAVVSDAHLS